MLLQQAEGFADEGLVVGQGGAETELGAHQLLEPGLECGAEMIVDRVNAMRDIVHRVAPRIPEAQAVYTDKLRQRLTEALGGANDERVLQEVAVFATRIDVAEELARLGSHLSEIQRLLDAGREVGKRLDFLIQELQREANTLGSKSAAIELSTIAVEMKVAIEQMREASL